MIIKIMTDLRSRGQLVLILGFLDYFSVAISNSFSSVLPHVDHVNLRLCPEAAIFGNAIGIGRGGALLDALHLATVLHRDFGHFCTISI